MTQRARVAGVVFAGLIGTAALAQQAAAPAEKPREVYQPTPSFDLSSIDATADPCQDFYKFACGHYAANHPIPADQSSTDGFYQLFNVNTQQLSGILEKVAVANPSRTPNEQKIGDFYHACMDTDAINRKGLTPLASLLKQIDAVDMAHLMPLTGKLQRFGVNVFFGYGEQQDFKDASKQIATIDQGGLGMPEKDFYLRKGAKDDELRKDYVAYVAKMLTLSGIDSAAAAKDADGIMAFETALAKVSDGVTERRDPQTVYHLVPVAKVSTDFPGNGFVAFEDAIHSPHVTEINNANLRFLPDMMKLVKALDPQTLHAYMRFHLLSDMAAMLPKDFDDAHFDFYGRQLQGTTEQRARWKRCSGDVNSELGEALGQVYVSEYFAGDSKKKTLEMVTDIENAMDRDIDALDWMSAATKVKAKEKLHAVANKIGYPDHWRDYSKLTIAPDDAMANTLRASAFENDRQLHKIGRPVNHNEWGMTPPTVNAYYDSSMNDINFPAGILQPNFYDPKADDAVNYGHIGAVIGHELTHGFDDQGRKFDAKGNLTDWWTNDDSNKFGAKTDCVVNEYNQFVPVDDLHINGNLTLGENTADNGGLLLAYLAYMERAKQQNIDLTAKLDGYTPPQRFYIAYAQNWCSNDRPEALRTGIQTDPHSPDTFRSNGVIVNQPGFAGAFSCKAGTPMVPEKSCRVW